MNVTAKPQLILKKYHSVPTSCSPNWHTCSTHKTTSCATTSAFKSKKRHKTTLPNALSYKNVAKCAFYHKKVQKTFGGYNKNLYLCTRNWETVLRLTSTVWKFGWVAETSSLLNCRTGNRTGGSNPPASAVLLSKQYCWWIHLMVRIQDSQSWHRGSIPLSTTKQSV